MIPQNPPLPVYTLMVLYLLQRTEFTLSKAQICDFAASMEYCSFLTMQQTLSQMDEDGLISSQTDGNRTFLSITDDGKETLRVLFSELPYYFREGIDHYISEHRWKLRNDTSIRSSYKKTSSDEFTATLSLWEMGAQTLHIQMAVPTADLAEAICENWNKKSADIYQHLVDELF